MERLRHYLWFGNLAELEAVLGEVARGSTTPGVAANRLLAHLEG